jgi:murein DD-endopeptidase MepM/ murein hydrolase activator NlpD
MLLAGRVEPRWLSAVGTTQIPSLLKFPVARGWFVRGFGSGAGAYHQAMDIGGNIGWNVRAAAPGLVGYAGDEVNGYGNLILVIHAGGFITAYGHNSKNRVIAGQRIERGEVVAELGSTGRSKGPHVHFELLHRGNNCDPAPLFRPDVRRKNGKVVPVPRAVWKTPNKRPKAIRCFPRKHHPDHTPRLELNEPEEADDEAVPSAAAAPAGD